METKILQQIQKQVEEFIEHLGVSPEIMVESDEENQIRVKLFEKDDKPLGFLIGYHGETLRSLQLLLSLMVNKGKAPFLRILLDIGDYRKAREETLEQMAKEAVEKVKETGEPVELWPMSPMDRRFIHLTVSKISDLQTESVGEDYDRRVVIKLASLAF